MEVSKSAKRKNYLQHANEDRFEIMKTAIMVASNHPLEFRTKRHKIAPTLFSDEFIKHSNQCDKCKKHSPKVSPFETEKDTKTVAEALNASFMIKEEGRECFISHGKPPMEKQTVATCKQKRPLIVRIKLNTKTTLQIPKGPATPEKKVNDHGVGFYCDQGVAEVMRMKKTLEKSGDESESESVVLDLLKKLQSMELSYKTLEATRIGITVNALKKHELEQVRKMAGTLVKSWKDMVIELIKKPSSSDEQKSNEVKPTNANLNFEKRFMEGSEIAPKTGNGEAMNSFEKLEATKRKQKEGYSASENMMSQSGKACPTMIPIKVNTETEFQIQKGPATPEKKVDVHGAMVYDKEVVEVFRIKKILEDIGDETESELVLCDMLAKLQCMSLCYKTLEATVIGKPVTGLKKHPLEKVRKIAGTLVKAWKCTAVDQYKKPSNDVEPKSQKMEPTNMNTNTKNGLACSENAAKIGNGGVIDSSEKLEAAKRKLQEGYEKVENMKKKRRIQVMELHEVTEQGLLPKETSRINHNRRRVYRRC